MVECREWDFVILQSNGQMHIILIGFVRNLIDSNVEVVAKGPQKSLDNLIIDLKSGPPGCVVSACVVNWRSAIDRVQGFTIKF